MGYYRTMNETWASNFAGIVAATIAELAPKFAGESIAMFAIDCHPWNGILALCALTESECVEDPELRDPAEMAAWRFFDCSNGVSAWSAATALSESMRVAYDSADDRASVGITYLQYCADALADSRVADAVSKLDVSSKFRFSVTHPDDGTEYCDR
jgi:hypothetical protein